MVRHADLETVVQGEALYWQFPKNRRGTPCRATQGSGRVGQEAEEAGENVGKSPYYSFHVKEWVKQA